MPFKTKGGYSIQSGKGSSVWVSLLVLTLFSCGTRKSEVDFDKVFSQNKWNNVYNSPGDRVYFAAPRQPFPKQVNPLPPKQKKASYSEPSNSMADTTIFREGENGARMRISFGRDGEFREAECICPDVEVKEKGAVKEKVKTKDKEVNSTGRTNIFALLLFMVIGFVLGFYVRGLSWAQVLGFFKKK